MDEVVGAGHLDACVAHRGGEGERGTPTRVPAHHIIRPRPYDEIDRI